MDGFEPYFWVLAALLAALGQSIRSAIQKSSRQALGIYGSAMVRFVFGVPLASLLLVWFVSQPVDLISRLPSAYFMWLVPAAIIQIIFTLLLGYAFEQRNFATSIALSKTDVIQSAFFEMLLLAIVPAPSVIIAMSIGLVAVWFIARARASQLNNLGRRTGEGAWRSVVLGLAAGLALGSCSVFFRIALEAVPDRNYLEAALFTAVMAIFLQTIVLGSIMAIWRRQELYACLRSGRISLYAGSIASLTTFMWFVAFSLNGVAAVRMVGQVEIVFSLLFSFWLFKERISTNELIGAALIMTSVFILLSQAG